MAEGDNNFIF